MKSPAVLTPTQYRQTIAMLVAELFPPEEHDRWILTGQPALNGDWPALAMVKGKEAEVYKILLRLKQGN